MTKEKRQEHLNRLRDRLMDDFTNRGLPGYMWGGVERWVMDGFYGGGGFLRAVFEDQLTLAFALADEENTANMRNWAAFMYHDVPAACRRKGVHTWEGYNKMFAEEEDAA